MKKILELLFAYSICLLVALSLAFRAQSVNRNYQASNELEYSYVSK